MGVLGFIPRQFVSGSVFEIEIKAHADHASLRSELVALDAGYEGSVYQVDTYFDHPCRSFEATDEALRMRRERNRESGSDPHGLGEVPHGATIVLTYKGPRVDADSKTRAEHETIVDSEDSLHEILDALGFTPLPPVKKTREHYSYKGFTVTLDSVEDLGSFVEIETQGTKDDIDPLREEALSILEQLGGDPDETIHTSYLALLFEE